MTGASPSDPIVLRSRHVWCEPEGRFLPRSVRLSGGRVASVEPAEPGGPAPGETQILDLGDHYLLPGLINTHVHLEFSASPRPLVEFERESGEDRLLRALGNARRMLASGVTTIRDCGSSWAMLALARHPEFAGIDLPEIVCSGPPITVANGHLHMMGGVVDSAEGALRHIARAVEAGARSVKVMASGGGMTPGSVPERPSFSLETLALIAGEARRRGLPSVAHALATESIRRAALARFDSLEHCAFFERAPSGLLERRYDAEVARVVADSGVSVMANLSTATRALDRIGQRGDRAAEEQHQLDQFDLMLENFGRMLELGIPIVCGTDAGVRDTPFEDTWRELAVMSGAGMTPVEAIRSATIRAAAVLGRGDRIGRITPGFDADLIVVDADPLQSFEALARPSGVIAKGRFIAWPADMEA